MSEAPAHTARIIDGAKIANEICAEVKERIVALQEATGRVPGLATILVGERKDSATYVRLKHRRAEEVGIKNIEVKLPDTVSEEELLDEIRKLAERDDCHGILLQIPLPKHINETRCTNSIPANKDVDGLTPPSVAALCMRDLNPTFTACTPAGVMELLKREGVPIRGAHAVVVGRSNIVGRPMAQLLLRADATVTVVHSATKDPAALCRTADIVVSAVGRPGTVTKEWIKPGAVVIDVGTTPVTDETKKAGYRLAGDVSMDVREVAGAVTPGLEEVDQGFEASLEREKGEAKEGTAPAAAAPAPAAAEETK